VVGDYVVVHWLARKEATVCGDANNTSPQHLNKSVSVRARFAKVSHDKGTNWFRWNSWRIKLAIPVNFPEPAEYWDLLARQSAKEPELWETCRKSRQGSLREGKNSSHYEMNGKDFEHDMQARESIDKTSLLWRGPENGQEHR
jgi:hypothetical protein